MISKPNETFRDVNYSPNKSAIRVMNDRKGIVRVGDRRYTRGWEHKYQARHAIKGKGGFFSHDQTGGECRTDARLIDFSR